MRAFPLCVRALLLALAQILAHLGVTSAGGADHAIATGVHLCIIVDAVAFQAELTDPDSWQLVFSGPEPVEGPARTALEKLHAELGGPEWKLPPNFTSLEAGSVCRVRAHSRDWRE